ADDPFFERLSTWANGPILSFGFSRRATVRALRMQSKNPSSSTVCVGLSGRRHGFSLHLNVAGRHNIANAMAAVATGTALGVGVSRIQTGLARYWPAAMRSQVRHRRGAILLNDCYNANPASLRAALERLAGRQDGTRPGKTIETPLMDPLQSRSNGYPDVAATEAAGAGEQFGGRSLLYLLLYPLHSQFSIFNVFRYLSFRIIYAAITAFLIAFVLAPPLIRKLQSYGIGQKIREEGPRRHQVKGGTPTMGGLLILFAVMMATLLWTDLTSPYVWLAMFAMGGFGTVGLWDDYLKYSRGKNQGLSSLQKVVAQAAVGIAISGFLYYLPAYSTKLSVPFFKSFTPDLG